MRDDDQHTDDQHQDHVRRITRIMQSFAAGEISGIQKRRYIADENAAYYKNPDMCSQSTGEKLAAMPYASARGAAGTDRLTGCAPTAAYLEARAALGRRSP